MKMQQSFDVKAPIDTVWEALTDPARVAPCLPGAAITGQDEDGSYEGEFTVKLGPTTANYRGTLKITEADETLHRAVLTARGTDKRGQGGASATIVNTMETIDGGTRVLADTDFVITGRLARFGRGGMIEDISNRLLREFSECLQATLEVTAEPAPAPTGDSDAGSAPAAAQTPAEPTAKPVRGFSLLLSVLWERMKRRFGRRR